MQLNIITKTPNDMVIRQIRAAAQLAGITTTIKESTSLTTPFQRTPLVETPSGLVSGCYAALRYIANVAPAANLYGMTIADRMTVDSLLDALAAEIRVPLAAASIDGTRVTTDVTRGFSALNEVLASQLFLASVRLTIADLAAAGAVGEALRLNIVKAEKVAADWPHLARLFSDVHKQFTWTGIPTVTVAPLEDSKESTKKNAPKKESAGKKEAPKKEAAGKKEAAKKEQQAVKETEDVSPVAPKKETDPLDQLPPTSFDLENWKRVYANSKNLRGEAIPFFWENLDKEGYSAYHYKYVRYNDQDNVKDYAASNLMRMFLQRIDGKLRRHSFVIADVLKDDGFFDVEGIYIIRGKGIPDRLKEHQQWDSFVFTPLDWDKEEDRRVIEDFIAEEEKINGREIADCKLFK